MEEGTGNSGEAHREEGKVSRLVVGKAIRLVEEEHHLGRGAWACRVHRELSNLLELLWN